MALRAFLLAFLFFPMLLLAQENSGKVALRGYLLKIGNENGVHISFVEETVSGLFITPPTGSFKEKIADIGRQTRLSFEFVNENYLVVGQGKALCFTVTDAQTGLPIPSATINCNGKILFSADDGIFCIDKPSVFTLSHIGYQTVNVPINSNGEIRLVPMPEILPETPVVHFLTRGIRLSENGSYAIESKRTGLLPGLTEPDVFQTLQQMPGAISFDETVSNISVRGGTHDQNLFLWNGLRLFQTGHFFGLISVLNPNLSHSISVWKNATPAQMGDAVSGTVVIETLPETGSYYENSIGVNLLNFDFNTAFKTSGKTSWQFSGRRSTTDFFNSPTYQSYYDRIFQNTKVTNLFIDQDVDYRSSERFYFYDFTGQFRQKFGKRSELQINAIFIENELEVFQRLATTLVAQESELKQQSFGSNTIFRTDWNARHHTSFSVFYSRYRVDSEDISTVDNTVGHLQNVIAESGFTFRHTFKIRDGWTLKSGYHLTHSRVHDLDNGRHSDRELLSHAIFSQTERKWKKWYVFAGIRQQFYQSIDRWRSEPRFVAAYEIGKGFRASVQAEMKSQGVQQTVGQQQDFFGLEKRQWTVSGDGAPLVTSEQISIPLSFRKNRWLISVEPFYKKVRDISSRSQGFQNQFELENSMGDYRVLGLEVLLQKQFGPLTAWINYHYNDNQYDFPSLSPSRFPNVQSVPHALRSGLVYDDTKWQFALGSNWQSGKYYTAAASRIQVFDQDYNLSILYREPNARRLDDYVQVNLSGSFSQKLGKTQLRIGFSVLNVLDDSSVINRSYRINSVNSTVEEVNISSLGRTFNGFLRLFF